MNAATMRAGRRTIELALIMSLLGLRAAIEIEHRGHTLDRALRESFGAAAFHFVQTDRSLPVAAKRLDAALTQVLRGLPRTEASA